MKHKMMQALITIKARDYAAFEDLAHELGIEVSECKFVDAEEVTPKQPRKGRSFMTKEMVERIKQYHADHPHIPQTQIVEHLNLPVSKATVNRVCLGHFDHLLEE